MSVLDTTDVLDVAGYAAAVRRSLADLGPEVVEDLTDDLEADLAEAMADERHTAHGRGLLEQFGSPEEYAAELRAAAGLAPAVSRGPRQDLRYALGAPARGARRLGAWTLRSLRAQPWWGPVESFLVALRPVWWLVRGWIGYELVAMYFGSAASIGVPRSLLSKAVLLAAVVVSVQYGRGVWLRGPRTHWLAVTANVVAVVALLPVVGWVQGQLQWQYAQAGAYAGGAQTIYQDKPVDGVVVDGMQVSNLFAYDAEGNPLTDVQIYDDRGRPVRTTFDNGLDPYWLPEGDEPWSFVSSTDADGRSRWNLYPLQGAPTSAFSYDDAGMQVLPAGTSPSTPPWPFAKAPALDAPQTSTIGAEGPSATPSPSATPGPTPTP
ncbi:HAAS signaling domain-containing protein [Cellulomonas sp. ICMP 17802]|uniref:HAAS signaling domain-containing protein n=1 Tax=Cellulomonas sp. ICMP 17802 TaxID=3239199 RepID=UPI00351AB22E